VGEGTVRLSLKSESDRITQRSVVQIHPPQPNLFSVRACNVHNLKQTLTKNDGTTQTSVYKGLGPASLGEKTPDPSYTCDATTLKFKLLVWTFTFTRQGEK
jgi:hypothetical protein